MVHLNVAADLTYTKICKVKLNLIIDKFQLMAISLNWCISQAAVIAD